MNNNQISTYSKKKRSELLKDAISIMKKGRNVYLPGNYWTILGRTANKQFLEDGFEKMKIRQGLHYFQFLVFEWSYWQFQYVWKRSSWRSALQAALPALTSPLFSDFPMVKRQRWLFIYYHFLLWDYVKRQDTRNLLELAEPLFGTPLLVKWRNHVFTQDLLNSIIETYSILEALNVTHSKPKTILEVGGGYGRNMYVLKHIFPKSKIIMVDIPPAILLAQWYISNVFPESKILMITDHTKILNTQEYKKADFVFLLPHQIELLPDKEVDLFININSFQEMSLAQLKTYFKQIDRLTKKVFYTKKWKKQDNPQADVQIGENEYPVYTSWKELFHRDAQVQSRFFEAADEIK